MKLYSKKNWVLELVLVIDVNVLIRVFIEIYNGLLKIFYEKLIFNGFVRFFNVFGFWLVFSSFY